MFWKKKEAPAAPRVLKTLTPINESLVVRTIEDNCENVGSALGLTQERGIYLQELLTASLRKTGNVVAVMEEVSPHCVHPNELFFASLVLGSIWGRKQFVQVVHFKDQ